MNLDVKIGDMWFNHNKTAVAVITKITKNGVHYIWKKNFNDSGYPVYVSLEDFKRFMEDVWHPVSILEKELL